MVKQCIAFLLRALTAFLLFFSGYANTQNISGIINKYVSVTAISCSSITVTNSSGYHAGDTVMIIQMKGAITDTTNDHSTFGTITNYNDIGNYEFGIIQSIAGNVINLKDFLLRSYNPSEPLQLIRVPYYKNATVVKTLTALAWNGSVGGILAFQVAGKLTMNANINVSGLGFVGGNTSIVDGSQQDTDYFYTEASGKSGEKGTGIGIDGVSYWGGRGLLANAAGGGNGHNSGGGGGGNFGHGGMGGDQWGGYGLLVNGGLGGDSLTYSNSLNRIFMGGGGGGPHQNNVQGTVGTNGGGIIYITADTIVGNKDSILANGIANNDTAGLDGAGGAGAGGAILLNVLNYGATRLYVSAVGGKGGSAYCVDNDCIGTGGGGGGGAIWVSTASLPGNVVSFFNGGLPGLDTYTGPCYLSPYGADTGKPGGIIYNLKYLIGVPGSFNLSGNDSICKGDTTILTVIGGTSYIWSNGSTTSSINVSPDSATRYTVRVYFGACSFDTAITVFMKSKPVGVNGTDSVCYGTYSVLTASGGTSYRWSTGATTSSITVIGFSTKTYSVIASTPCGNDTVHKTLKVVPYPTIHFSGNHKACKGQIDTLSATGGTLYTWSNGVTSSSVAVTVNTDTTMSVKVSNGLCTSDSIFSITIIPPPIVTITGPYTICYGDSVTLAATGGGTYEWSTGATTDSIKVKPTLSGSYSVTVTTVCNTTASTSVAVDIPKMYACCNDTIIKGDTVLLTANNNRHYKWSPATGLNCDTCATVIATPTVTTTYTVQGTDSNGCIVERIILITVDAPCENYYVPNVFTPNGDGRNEEFIIKTRNLDKYDITIYDRWGIEMYNSTNPDVYWNGKAKGGGDAPAGVYYYIINSTCQENTYQKTGFVQLIR